jgi:hypothetical protein
VTVPFYKEQFAVRAVIDGQRARGWNTSSARSDVPENGFVHAGTISPPNGGPVASMTITAKPSPPDNSDIEITVNSECFSN